VKRESEEIKRSPLTLAVLSGANVVVVEVLGFSLLLAPSEDLNISIISPFFLLVINPSGDPGSRQSSSTNKRGTTKSHHGGCSEDV